MNGEHLHAKAARGFDGSAGRVWNVVQLEIEPNLGARRQNRAHHFWTFRGIKLQPDFEKRDLVAEFLNELKRVPFCGHVQCDNDVFSVFGHSGALFVMSSGVETSQYLQPTARDSSTSLGMTEQIARNHASFRSCEDQSVAKNSRPAKRWLPRTRHAHCADFALR